MNLVTKRGMVKTLNKKKTLLEESRDELLWSPSKKLVPALAFEFWL